MTTQQMTARTTSMTLNSGVIASAGPARRVDEHGVLIGPWSASAKRASALLHATRRRA